MSVIVYNVHRRGMLATRGLVEMERRTRKE
jgi:hypothetical protein